MKHVSLRGDYFVKICVHVVAFKFFTKPLCVSIIVCSHVSNIAVSTPEWQKLKESKSREQCLNDILGVGGGGGYNS